MTLLARALTQRPDTPAAVLARIGEMHPHLRLAVLAHPAGADLGHDVAISVDALRGALHSPVATAGTRHRATHRVGLPQLTDYIHCDPYAHPSALAHVARNTTVSYGANGVLNHRVPLTGDDHLAVVRTALANITYATATEAGVAITHATRHGDHLAELTGFVDQLARTPRQRARAVLDDTSKQLLYRAVAADLDQYARAHAAGSSAHHARLRAIAISNLPPEEKVRRSVDPDLANELLSAHPTRDVARAILTTPVLAHTDAAYRALHIVTATAGAPADDPAADTHAQPRPPARAGVTYTPIELAHTPGYQHDHASQDAAVLAVATDPTSSRATLTAAADALTARTLTLTRAETLARLALHPAMPPHDRARLAAARVRLTHRDAQLERAPLLAVRPDALTATPLPDLEALAETTGTRNHLATHLARALPALDPHTAATALTLEPGFAGTLDELLHTATTLTR